ncbi:hypothetical protein CPLU01_15849, partial [Colletotrichum plurivorum]
MVPHTSTAEDEIRSGHYVPPAERGQPDEPIRDANDVIASLEDRYTDTSHLEAESSARLGGIRSHEDDPEEMHPRQIHEEICEITSTGLVNIEPNPEHTPEERLRVLRQATVISGRRYRGRKPRGLHAGASLASNSTEPFIICRRGEEFADSNDPDFFPKAFPCLFPWGRGGPKVLHNEDEREADLEGEEDEPAAEELLKQFQAHISNVQHVVRDPVSSAKFFHREMDLYFKHLVSVGEDSVFGKVSCYFGCVETNERGALHLHGFLWLDANAELPNLLEDMADPSKAAYAEQVCEYIDSVFSECGDEGKAKQYRKWESRAVFNNIQHITQDMNKFAENYDNEANLVACRCQMHSCGATCTKYSINDKGSGKCQHLCRFKAPWAQWPKTEITPSGLLKVRRNHSRINRYCPALAVAMRHNTDATFLLTNSASLSMLYYATNYSTKLDTPLWRRAALMLNTTDGLADEGDNAPAARNDGTAKTAQTNNKTRQFFSRLANQIFTSREISSVEVCSSLLRYKNYYCNERKWKTVALNALYWVLFRQWGHLRDAAGPEMQRNAAPEVVSFSSSGQYLPHLEAYKHRGPILEHLCFYEYAAMVNVKPQGPRSRVNNPKFIHFASTLPSRELWIQELYPTLEQAVPVMSGYLDYNPQGTEEGFYQSAEDAKRDAKLWDSRSEGDQGREFDPVDDELDTGTAWQPNTTNLRHAFHDAIHELKSEVSVVKNSPGIQGLLKSLDDQDFSNMASDSDGDGNDDTDSEDNPGQNFACHTPLVIAKRDLSSTKAAQDRLHKERMIAIEGDDIAPGPSRNSAGTGFDDDMDNSSSLADPTPPRTWVGIAPSDSFMRAGAVISGDRTLNRMQRIALGLVCEALDRQGTSASQQHLQYIGGGGGTGKSWLIDSLREVFAAKGASSRLVITATSGTAAAGIGGTTIHSAVGLTFKDQDGVSSDTTMTA